MVAPVAGPMQGVSVDPAISAGPLALAQHELLDLAGARLREISKLDGPRAFEMGQDRAAVRDHYLGGEARAGTRCDERFRYFAPFLVRDGDDCAFEHVGVPQDRLLHLDG